MEILKTFSIVNMAGAEDPVEENPPVDLQENKDFKGFGGHLRRERELRNISLEEVSATTRVNIRYLRALEEGKLEDLPAPAFIKGFLAAYAKHIGLNPEEVLTYFEEVSAGYYRDTGRKELTLQKIGKGHIIMTILIIGLAGLFFFSRITSRRTIEELPTIVEEPTITSPVELPERMTAPVESPILPGEEIREVEAGSEAAGINGEKTIGGGVEIVLRAEERSWVYAVIDEQDVRDFFLEENEEIYLDARRVVSLTLGNAGGVKVKFNGRELPPLGKVREVKRNLRFTWEPEQGAEMHTGESF